MTVPSDNQTVDKSPEAKTRQPELNQKQELFCQLYATDKEFFANGTQAYIEAYDKVIKSKKDYMAAAAAASRLLKDVKVLTRINQLLEMRGLNDQFVDKQLEFLITQDADFKTKISAIKEYNQLKKRTGSSEQPPPQGGNTYNTFIQQNTIDPNSPQARKLVESQMRVLLEQTKWQVEEPASEPTAK